MTARVAFATFWPALLVVCSCGFADDAKPNNRPIIVIAHRGAHDTFPENTLASIGRAVELGCDYVEVDVRATKDGKLVLLHDGSVDRTTDGRGKIDELTFDEIRRLGVRPVSTSDTARHKVPTFEEALAACRGKIKVYVDHKAGEPAEIYRTIKQLGMISNVVVYGSVDQLREFKRLDPAIWIMPGHPGSPDKIRRLAAELGPETLDGNLSGWTKDQVDAAHEAGAQVWVDNLGPSDNERGYRLALEFGVDAIQTDHPEALLQFLRNTGRR